MPDTETRSFEAEVAARFGLLPNFFRSATAAPDLIQHLWAFAKASYLDNPLPSLFKERLFVYLSRFCEVRYCIVRHVGFLVGLGHPAGDPDSRAQSVEDVVALLRRPVASPELLAAAAARLEAGGRLAAWPLPASALEDDLFSCLTALFVAPARSDSAQRALRACVGDRDFELLVGFLAFIRAAHYWTLMHPEIEIEADTHRLMREHGALARLMLEDSEANRCDIDQRMFEELQALRALNERQELLAAKRLLEDKDRQKDQFIAVLGHELRNPLAAIHAASETLGLIELDDARVDHLRSILQRQTVTMGRMLDDLLDASRIALGNVSIDAVAFDLAMLVREVLDDAEARTRDSGKRIEVALPDTPVVIRGDRVRVTQVIDNVLSNAIKFTPPGGWIALQLVGAGGRATLSIADSGIGFAPGFEREMFTPFVQAEQSLERPTGGLGLGLAIGKRLMELHGGTLSAASEGVGKGARFVLEFALVAAAEAPKARASVGAAMRILLVEDNPDVALAIAGMIRWAGHEVDVAPDGVAALRQARAVRPDLILCDLGLPGEMNGFDVARACRDDAGISGIRLVAISGYGGGDYRQRAHASGYDDMVTKPLGLAKLRAIVAAGRPPA